MRLCLLVSFIISQGVAAFTGQLPKKIHSKDALLYPSRRAPPIGYNGFFCNNHQIVLRLARGDGGRGIKDPNPGGLNDWDNHDHNDDDNNEDQNMLDVFRSWLKSEEGKSDVQTYTVSLGVALLIRMLIIEPRYIPSLSMYPTFEVGDQLAVEKVTKRFRPLSRNQIVVFNPPERFREIINTEYGGASKKGKEALIKRVVAVEGNTVRVSGGKLYINGKKQVEPFTAEDAAYEFGPVVVPPGEVLVLGDNRNHSLDGHIWGFLPKEMIIGRAVFVYWPPWRLGNEGMY